MTIRNAAKGTGTHSKLPVKPIKKCTDTDRTPEDEGVLITCPLDGCMFSSGAVRGLGPGGSLAPTDEQGEAFGRLRDALKLRSGQLISVHANYIVGNTFKMRAFQHHGLWLALQQGGGNADAWNGCGPYKDIGM